MKPILISIFLALTLFASSTLNHLKVRILEKIISELSLNKKTEVWSDNKEILSELKDYNKLIVTERCEDATIIILEEKKNLTKECATKYIFVLNYKLLLDVPKSFGAFFWKKGRPNIVIVKPRIKSQSIEISDDLKPYLEDKVW